MKGRLWWYLRRAMRASQCNLYLASSSTYVASFAQREVGRLNHSRIEEEKMEQQELKA